MARGRRQQGDAEAEEALVVWEASDVADAGPIEEVPPEAALEGRAGGGGNAERGEVEGASEGIWVVRQGPAAAERGPIEGRRVGRRGGEGFKVDTEEEASGAGTAREEEAVGGKVERWRHGTQRQARHDEG